MTTQAPDALRLVPVSLIADTMNWMARAYERIHGLPRISDTDLADKVGAAKERLRPYLDAPAVQPAAGREEMERKLDKHFASEFALNDDEAAECTGHILQIIEPYLAATSTPAQASETGGVDHADIAARLNPDLFSSDERTAHRAASPYAVSIKRAEAVAEVGRVLAAAAALSAPQAAPGEGEQS